MPVPKPVPKPVIVSIASHVARGHVGNSMAVFALQRLGFEVWDIPTVLLPFHPGHGPGTRLETPPEGLAGLLADLERRGGLEAVAGVLTGYLGHEGHAAAIAGFMEKVKAANRDAVYCCDPVIGDNGALYVAPDIAAGIRDGLIPLADMATPNAFELAWLTGADSAKPDNGDLAVRAGDLGPRQVFVTSAIAMMRNQAAVLRVEDGTMLLAEAPAVPHPPHGLGDLMAALLLANRLTGRGAEDGLRRAVASVHDLAHQTRRQGRDEVPLSGEQHRLVRSSMIVQMRQLA